MSDDRNGSKMPEFRCMFQIQDHEKMIDSHRMITQLHGSTDCWERIASAIEEVRDKVIDTALGKTSVPVDVVREMIAEQRKAYTGLIKMVCIIFGTIILTLVGLKYLAPHLLGGG